VINYKLSHGNGKEKKKQIKKGGYGVKRGDAVSCSQVPVVESSVKHHQANKQNIGKVNDMI
jgi:hypothetical protein